MTPCKTDNAELLHQVTSYKDKLFKVACYKIILSLSRKSFCRHERSDCSITDWYNSTVRRLYLSPAVAASPDLLLHLDPDPPALPAGDVAAVPDHPAQLLPVLSLQLDHAALSHHLGSQSVNSPACLLCFLTWKSESSWLEGWTNSRGDCGLKINKLLNILFAYSLTIFLNSAIIY